jgi:predicted  nucleic acid-binding Zn-ribbon protein
MPKSRLATLAYLVLVFGSGTMVGAVAHRLYVTSSVTASTVVPKTPAQARKDFLEKLKVRLTASPDQVTQVNTILDEAKQKYSRLELEAKPLRDKIDEERVEGILAVLTPEQQKNYLAWRAEVKAKREQKALAEKVQAEKAAGVQSSTPPTR